MYELRKWNENEEMIVAVNAIYAIIWRKEAWRKKYSGLQRGLNPWPRDTGVMLYQLSFDATDVGSRSRYKIC